MWLTTLYGAETNAPYSYETMIPSVAQEEHARLLYSSCELVEEPAQFGRHSALLTSDDFAARLSFQETM